jgi:hypothetical protein
VESQHSFIHEPGKESNLLNLFSLWNAAQFILQRNGNFGSRRRIFCSLFCWAVISISVSLNKVSKLTEYAKY